MKNLFCLFLFLHLGFFLIRPAAADDAQNQPTREHLSADLDWKFILGDPANAQAPAFDDGSWRSVDLPHDWSIEGKTFDPKSPTDGGEGFLPEGIGFYRHTFNAPLEWQGKKVMVEFEGVYMNARVWLNGRELGTHPYGYTSFYFDLTPDLKLGAANVLAVRVDNSLQQNSRWYSGSGIYRHVWFTVTGPVHIAPWGVFVQTPEVTDDAAKMIVQVQVANEGDASAAVTLHTTVLGPDGQSIADGSDETTIAAGAAAPLVQKFTISHPATWSPDNPRLCRAVTQILQDGKVVDQMETKFGIRSLAWSATAGLQLNGKTIQLCGGCAHNDLGCLGSASFDRAEERRVEMLKAGGFNAVRLSHNPPAPALLDACDRLGLLVMDEAFDCWEKGKRPYDYHLYFDDWWKRDLDSMVMRDRNHPSVVFWSIGNEIPATRRPASPSPAATSSPSPPTAASSGAIDTRGVQVAHMLSKEVHSLDTSRPVTEAIVAHPKTPAQTKNFDLHCTALDIVGTNYHYDNAAADHLHAPSRVMVITESFPHDLFKTWSLVQDESYLTGDFVWTALDYLGESGIGRWDLDVKGPSHGSAQNFPWHGAYCGDIDIDGVRKPISHYRDIVWNRGEKLFLSVDQPVHPGHEIIVSNWGFFPEQASWTWPGFENNPVHVNVYSRYDSVQLYLNDKLIGEKPTTRNEEFKATFDLPYQPGTLKAVGLLDGKPAEQQVLSTAGEPAAIRLTADRSQLKAGGQDLSFINVEVVDKEGHLVPNADQEIHFKTSGEGTIAGVGNGDMTSMEPYQGDLRKVFQGRALIVVRTTRQPGAIQVEAQADGLAPATLSLQSQ